MQRHQQAEKELYAGNDYNELNLQQQQQENISANLTNASPAGKIPTLFDCMSNSCNCRYV